ncbi:hypothetical protein BH10BDE1_BH10BDE1_20450 [soil metagenome]
MSGRIVAAILLIAIAFVAGRFSVRVTTKAVELDKSISADTAVAEPAIEVANKAIPEPAASVVTGAATSREPGPITSNLKVHMKSDECLARVSRREVYEWLAGEEERMTKFQPSDPNFASRITQISLSRSPSTGAENQKLRSTSSV